MAKQSRAKGMYLLSNGNRILEETLRDQICRDPELKRQQLLDVKLCDFDEVGYSVKIDSSKTDSDTPPLTLSISTPCFQQIVDCDNTDEIKKVFGDFIADEPLAGYDLTLKVEFDKLPSDQKEKEELVHKMSRLKHTVLSSPFRKYFTDLENDKNSKQGFKFDIRSDTSIYFCPRDDRVTVIYAIDFQEKVDKTLAAVFMQELVDARKRVRTGPPFSWGVNPPTELVGDFGVSANPGILGYASIAMMKQHVRNPEIIGALINFRSFLQYHIKCAKSYFHQRMRMRCSDLLKVLNRAKVRFGETAKKTKSGKTFKRQI